MTGHAIIIGGTGQIGCAVAKRLLIDGWQVTLASRGQRSAPEDLSALGAKAIALDREAPGALGQALAGGADTVIDTIAYDASHADQLLEVEDDVGTFVIVSSCSVYKDEHGRSLDDGRDRGYPDFGGAVSETNPTVDPGPNSYSTRKAALEQRLLERSGRPVAIIRPGAIHGPYTQHPREWWFLKRMLDGRAFIPLAYRGESRMHTTGTANLAAVIAAALAARTTCILNAGDPVAPSVAEIGRVIAHRMNYRGDFVPLDIGDEYGTAPVGWTPWSLPKPFVLSTDAASQLGYEPAASYTQEVGGLCDWLLQQDIENWQAAFPVLAGYPLQLFDYAAEDNFVAALRK